MALCLVAATVFWFFNALNKTYTTQLSFPVEFQYDQDNFVSVGKLPTQVKMNVTGMGWTLIRRSVGVKVPPLLLLLERPSEVKKIIGSTLSQRFANQVEDLQINFIATDTLHLDIEPLDGRWLSVTHSDLQKFLKKGYGLASTVTITPDSVFVQGPRSLVESLPEPYPVQFSRKGIDESVEIQVPFFENDELIIVEPTSVQVSFRVEKLIEHRDSVKLEIIHIPSKLKPVVDSRLIHYTFQLPTSVLHTNYNRNTIRAILDFEKINTKKARVAPQVSGLPLFAKLLQVDSIQVSF